MAAKSITRPARSGELSRTRTSSVVMARPLIPTVRTAAAEASTATQTEPLDGDTATTAARLAPSIARPTRPESPAAA